MTKSIRTPQESEVNDKGDISILHPVSAVEAAVASIAHPVTASELIEEEPAPDKKKKSRVKSAVLIVAGSAAAVLLYKRLNRPIPKTEQIARKVRKVVWSLEANPMTFPEVPPHVRKTVKHHSVKSAKIAKKAAAATAVRAVVIAKAGKKVSVATAKVAKAHLDNHRKSIRKAIHS